MMQIKMKDAGESPEFGPYEAGMIFDEDRIDAQVMRVLMDRGIAEEVVQSALRTPQSEFKKEEVTDHV
jgi:hypothetical protein